MGLVSTFSPSEKFGDPEMRPVIDPSGNCRQPEIVGTPGGAEEEARAFLTGAFLAGVGGGGGGMTSESCSLLPPKRENVGLGIDKPGLSCGGLAASLRRSSAALAAASLCSTCALFLCSAALATASLCSSCLLFLSSASPLFLASASSLRSCAALAAASLRSLALLASSLLSSASLAFSSLTLSASILFSSLSWAASACLCCLAASLASRSALALARRS
mmetsp:Transcript_19252/g.39779  ORF Transcript_19252/g.39779 Transcript_19252/m.39779 type:complete len:219 (+) Transcript_19252:1521-2177(+)